MSSDIVYENQDDAGAENQFYRAVKTYVLRKGRMTAAQERDYNELSPVWCIPFENKKINFVDIFGNTNPVVVEIGFGMGTATAEIAGRNPDINYIGIEVHTPGVGRLLGEIRKRDLKNLFIIEHDALEVLECMIVDGSISGFHIFFPDPWQKKRHHKRRLDICILLRTGMNMPNLRFPSLLIRRVFIINMNHLQKVSPGVLKQNSSGAD